MNGAQSTTSQNTGVNAQNKDSQGINENANFFSAAQTATPSLQSALLDNDINEKKSNAELRKEYLLMQKQL